MRPGIELLLEELGSGPVLEKHHSYRLSLRMWLRRGDPVVWARAGSLGDSTELEDNGTKLIIDLRFDRGSMFAGLFYGVEGMRVGGTRKLRIAPHLAYRKAGVPGSIPANALLLVEVEVLAASSTKAGTDGTGTENALRDQVQP